MSNGLSKKPNIVLICTDQHNPAVTGCYGNATVDTPNMDRLAAEGIRFNSAYCSAPMCVPSRMSFLTGLYPFNNGTLDNDGILSSKVPTFAHVAGGNGYRTVLSGRMHFRGPDQYHGFMERIEGDVSPLFYAPSSIC
jgi:choline-sulfatase